MNDGQIINNFSVQDKKGNVAFVKLLHIEDHNIASKVKGKYIAFLNEKKMFEIPYFYNAQKYVEEVIAGYELQFLLEKGGYSKVD